MDLGRQVFTVDVLERHAAKGRGVVTCMAAGNDVIVIGTSKGWIIRHDFGVGDTYGTFISLITSQLHFLRFFFINLLSNSITLLRESVENSGKFSSF